MDVPGVQVGPMRNILFCALIYKRCTVCPKASQPLLWMSICLVESQVSQCQKYPVLVFTGGRGNESIVEGSLTLPWNKGMLGSSEKIQGDAWFSRRVS
jgi:hypothetical protein